MAEKFTNSYHCLTHVEKGKSFIKMQSENVTRKTKERNITSVYKTKISTKVRTPAPSNNLRIFAQKMPKKEPIHQQKAKYTKILIFLAVLSQRQ